MRDLRKNLREYIDLRRALGFRLRKHERRLSEFITFLEARRTDHITTKLAIAWAVESSKGRKHSCFERLSFIRSFATYVSSMDARTEIPPTGTMRRPTIALRPYIYTREEIGRLMAAARNLFSPHKLRCHTYYHLIGLLATTGMRSGEAVRLANSDVDLAEGLITIRESKFGKSRVVPLHSTTVKSLAAYKARRNAFLNKVEAPRFFISESRGPISSPHESFREIRRAAGLEETRNGISPRMHDLRHTFAVQTLLAWYRNGADVERNLPILSTFLGHSHIANTYWYLTSTPELLGAACERLETRMGEFTMSSANFAALLETFFTDRLIAQRRVSPHTVAWYRDTFHLLLQFPQNELGKSPSKLAMTDLNTTLIGAFLDNLERARANSSRSRNLRLTAIFRAPYQWT